MSDIGIDLGSSERTIANIQGTLFVPLADYEKLEAENQRLKDMVIRMYLHCTTERGE